MLMLHPLLIQSLSLSSIMNVSCIIFSQNDLPFLFAPELLAEYDAGPPVFLASVALRLVRTSCM